MTATATRPGTSHSPDVGVRNRGDNEENCRLRNDLQRQAMA